jgi:hypothetical protein
VGVEVNAGHFVLGVIHNIYHRVVI